MAEGVPLALGQLLAEGLLEPQGDAEGDPVGVPVREAQPVADAVLDGLTLLEAHAVGEGELETQTLMLGDAVTSNGERVAARDGEDTPLALLVPPPRTEKVEFRDALSDAVPLAEDEMQALPVLQGVTD